MAVKNSKCERFPNLLIGKPCPTQNIKKQNSISMAEEAAKRNSIKVHSQSPPLPHPLFFLLLKKKKDGAVVERRGSESLSITHTHTMSMCVCIRQQQQQQQLFYFIFCLPLLLLLCVCV